MPDLETEQPLNDDGDFIYESVFLFDDDGNECEFFIVDKKTHQGSDYCLLINSADEQSETAEAVIFKEFTDETGELIFQELDDNEILVVAALFVDDTGDYTIEL